MKKRKIKFYQLILTAALFALMLALGAVSAFAASDTCSEDSCGGIYVNGICNKYLSHYQKPQISEDGEYLISNRGEFLWFAEFANSNTLISGGDTPDDTTDDVYSLSASARLTADIDLNPGYEFSKEGVKYNNETVTEGFIHWKPIGNFTNNYSGIFDGNGKTVSGIYVGNPDETDEAGLFGVIADSSEVKNLGIKNSYFSAYYAGSITARNYGKITGCFNSAVVYSESIAGGICASNGNSGIIQYSYNEGGVYSKDSMSSIGGISGVNNGEISYCYNLGSVICDWSVGANEVGGIAGTAGGGKISGCYSSAEIIGSCDGGLVGELRGQIENSVCNTTLFPGETIGYVDADRGGTVVNCHGKDSAAFMSGEVTYLLNGDQTEIKYFQTCGVGYPAFSGERVYLKYTDSCAPSGFSNTPAEVINHAFVNGICNAVAGEVHYEAPTINNGTYEIKNVGNLFYIANEINNGNVGASISFVSDIDLAGMPWTPISNKGYKGKINGNYHVIKNMQISENSADGVGFFSEIQIWTEIKALGFENVSVENLGTGYTGALAGKIGQFTEIVDVYVTGTVSGQDGMTGAIVGFLDNKAKMKSCFTTEEELVGKIHGDATEYVMNSYSKTTENEPMFTSGELAYLLNGGELDIRYRQKIGEGGDAYPGFLQSETVYGICDGEKLLYSNSNTDLSHNLLYSAKDNVITESCAVVDCGHVQTATLALSDSEFIYTGAPITPALVNYSSGWFSNSATVIYENNVNAGAATAKITYGDKSASLGFEILKRKVSFSFEIQHILADGALDASKYSQSGLNAGHSISSPLMTKTTDGAFSFSCTVLDASGNDVTANYSLENTAGVYHVCSYVGENGQHKLDCVSDGCTYESAKTACSGGAATCKDKAKCSVCGAEYGEFTAHTGGTATCKDKAKCSVCGIEYGELGAHTDSDSNYKCDTCDISLKEGGSKAGIITASVLSSVLVLGTGGFSLYWFVIRKKKF